LKSEKRLIVNADDFGLSRGINEGIILAHQKGILTSATLMANMPGFIQAVMLAEQNPRLGVGVHLNILRGAPVSSSERVPSLVGPGGRFWTHLSILIRKLISKSIRTEDVETEWRAQLEKILAAGIRPTHFDSEKHLHTWPPLFRTVLKLANEYSIPRVRFIREYCWSGPPAQTLKSLGISLACGFMKKKIAQNGIMRPDHFSGICRSGRMTVRRWKRILAHLGEGTTEVMVHPGFKTDELDDLKGMAGPYYVHKNCEQELRALLDEEVISLVQASGIQLINFGGL
jgi:hopanoid biosynthesis associated protein HpnK